jgi:hypothetical protein
MSSLAAASAACSDDFRGDGKLEKNVSSSILLSSLCRQKHTCPEREKYTIIVSAVPCREGEEIPAVKQCTKCRYYYIFF